jgi:hypothetical protein
MKLTSIPTSYVQKLVTTGWELDTVVATPTQLIFSFCVFIFLFNVHHYNNTSMYGDSYEVQGLKATNRTSYLCKIQALHIVNTSKNQ